MTDAPAQTDDNQTFGAATADPEQLSERHGGQTIQAAEERFRHAGAMLLWKLVLAALVIGCWVLLSSIVARSEVIGPASPIGAPTVKVFLAGCQRDHGGCSLAIGNVLLDRTTFTGVSPFCLQISDYVDPITRWLTAHPETTAMTSADGIFLALKTLYPCA